MGSTRTQLRAAVYRELDEENFGFAFTAEASYGTDEVESKDQRLLANADQVDPLKYKNMYQYRPLGTTNNQVRRSNRLSVAAGLATLSHHGPAWDVGTVTGVELLVMHPDELHAYFNQALDNAKLPGLIPLGLKLTDMDMQDSDATAQYWNSNLSNATVAKQTSRVWRGARALAVTLTANSGYADADNLADVPTGKPGTSWTLARNQTGTGGYAALVDADGNVVNSTLFSERRWCFVRNRFTASDSQRQMRPRIGGTASGDVVDVNWAWIQSDTELSLTDALPSWMDDRFHITGLRMAIPRDAAHDDGDVWLADSCEIKELEEGEDYEFMRWEGDANPYAVRILKPAFMENPLFAVVNMPYRAPYGEDKSMTAETTTTECPLPRFLAEFKLVLASRWKNRFGHIAAEAAATKLTSLKQHQQARAAPAAQGWGAGFNRF